MKILFLIILLLITTSCKKEKIANEEIKEKQDFIGIYEIFPSYEKKWIEFKKEEYCEVHIEDKTKECVYKIINNLLLIYINSEVPDGIFLLDSENKKIKGLWFLEVRFLKKANK